MGGGLQDQRRFTDTRFPRNEGERTLHQAAAEDAVELSDSRIDAVLFTGPHRDKRSGTADRSAAGRRL